MVIPVPARRITALALTVGAAAAGTLVSAPTAQAVPVCTSNVDAVLVRDTTLALGLSNKADYDVVAAVSKACAVTKVTVTLRSPLGPETFKAAKLASDDTYNYWGVSVTLRAKYLNNADAGTWTTQVSATGATTDTKAGPKVKVQRQARLSANAKPEPVRKGKKITITGKLDRANWEAGRYAGYVGQKVALQWRSPKGSYSTVKTVTTGKGGALLARVTAKKDGCFRYVFAGTASTTKVTSKSDCVDVR